jgi:hypothetical protein
LCSKATNSGIGCQIEKDHIRAVHSRFDQTDEETRYCFNRPNEQYMYSDEQYSGYVLSYKFFARFVETGYEHP